jgi:molybdate transport system ATP-binding protein
MSLQVAVSLRRGNFFIDIAFSAAAGVTALFGPSGAGKTTVLNMIAGVVTPDSGQVIAEGAVLFDRAAGIDVPVHARCVGYVFQDGRLFPHLSVRANLDYGYKHVPTARRYTHPQDVIALLGLSALLDRAPATLSGGEQQRVAIGRALLTSPRILLLDEPLSSLDAARKDEIMPYLERLRDTVRVPMIYVSHDSREIERLASHIVHMDSGRVSLITAGISP